MAYTDFNISNNIAGYETEEQRRRREAAGQVGPISPETLANYSLSPMPINQVDESNMGLQVPESVQQQNIQMGQPAVMEPIMQQQPVIGGQLEQQDNVTPYIDMYQTAQKDPGQLLSLSQDQNAPEWMRSRAREQAASLLNNEKQIQDAQKQLPNMSPEDLTNALRQKTEGGSWLKAILFSSLGMDQSAQAEAAKLGIGKESAVMGSDGTPYMIKTALNGTPIEGYNAKTGQRLTAEELVSATAGSQVAKGTTTHTGKMQDVTTGEIYYERTTPQGIQLVDTNGKRYAGATSNLRAYGIGSDIATKNQIQLNSLRNEFIAKPSEAAAKTLMEAAAKADPGDGSEIARVQQLIRTLPMPSGAMPPAAMPSGAMPPAAMPAPAQTLPAAPVRTGVARTNVGSAGARRPGESFDAYNQRMAIAKSAAEGGIDVNVAEQKQFVEKVIPEVQKKGDDGKFVADTRRTQVSMLTGPNSPIMGIYRGSGDSYDKARAVLRDAVSGVYARTEDPNGLRLSEDLRNISIPAEQLSALREFVQMNTSINAKTLAENAGEGPKSDADVRMNQAANMTNIGDLPAYAALTGLTRSQFAGDINKRKQDFLNTNRDIYKTQSQLEAVWGKEKDMLNRQYEGIYKARLNYIDSQMVQKFGHDWRKKKDDDTQAFYRNASIHSFNVLPTPNYDTQTQKFVYPTQQSKIAAMRAITGK